MGGVRLYRLRHPVVESYIEDKTEQAIRKGWGERKIDLTNISQSQKPRCSVLGFGGGA
jgi:hypothetical protein